jgi:hypothetical protein
MMSLKVYGRFRLTDEHGVDLAPRSTKARGLIALLALAPEHWRSRIWLQDKLWSDRDAKQGAESLRQALMLIRRSLKNHAHVLTADREKVSLDAHHFTVDFFRPVQASLDEADTELFADLNIRDREFESWIRNQRLALDSRLERTNTIRLPKTKIDENPAIFLRYNGRGDRDCEIVGRSLLSLTAASLLDFSDFQIFEDFEPLPARHIATSKKGVVVDLAMSFWFGHFRTSITIQHPVTKRVYWARTFAIPSRGHLIDEEAIHPICAELIEAILGTLRSHCDDLDLSECGAILANRARSLIFRFDKSSLVTADRHLKLAYEYEPRPQYLAWRSFLRNMANFQHRSSSFLDDQIDVETLAHEAIHQAPNSATALAFGAHIEYLLGGSHRSSLQLAKRAVCADPINAINRAILSNSELVMGNLANGRKSALEALELAGNNESRAFIEFFCCMAAAAQGDYQASIDHAESALIQRSSFRAPLRYLIALYKQAGRTIELQKMVSRLRIAEPDFHIGRLLDDDYPVTTLRRICLIDAISK